MSGRSAPSLGLRVLRNSAWSILGWLSLLLLSLISSPFMVRELGSEFYGLLALLTSVVAPLGLMDLGMGEATIKYVAESLGRQDMRQVEHYLRTMLTMNVAMGLLGWLVLFFLSRVLVERVFHIPTAHQAMARECLVWLGASWCATQVRQTFIGAVSALQRYRALNIGTFLTQALVTGSGLVALLLHADLLRVVQWQSATTVLSCSAWWLLAAQLFPKLRLIPGMDRAALRSSLGFGAWQNLNNLGGILTHQSQRWLLGSMLSVASVGVYNLASQLVTMVYTLSYRGGQVLFPAVSQLQGESKHEEAAALMIQSNWVVTSLVLPGMAVVAVFAGDILRLWVGDEFSQAGTNGLRVLCISHGMSLVCAIPTFYLLGTGRPHWLSYVALAQGLLAIPTAFVLVPRWGVVGAATAMACGNLAQLTTVLLMGARLVRGWVRGSSYLAASLGPLSLCMVAGLVLTVLRSSVAWTPGWSALVPSAALTGIAFVILVQAGNLLLPDGSQRLRALLSIGGNYLASARRRALADAHALAEERRHDA
ncbi:MAG TPA: oligosaccharide flippase family protein [Polyangiales bacterium]